MRIWELIRRTARRLPRTRAMGHCTASVSNCTASVSNGCDRVDGDAEITLQSRHSSCKYRNLNIAGRMPLWTSVQGAFKPGVAATCAAGYRGCLGRTGVRGHRRRSCTGTAPQDDWRRNRYDTIRRHGPPCPDHAQDAGNRPRRPDPHGKPAANRRRNHAPPPWTSARLTGGAAMFAAFVAERRFLLS